MAQPEKPVPLEQEHVLTASGEFDVHDAPIDISHLPLRGLDRVRVLLGAGRGDLLPVLHALRAERLGFLDRRDRALSADRRRVRRRGDRGAQEQPHPGRFLLPLVAGATDARDVDRWSISRASLSSATASWLTYRC